MWGQGLSTQMDILIFAPTSLWSMHWAQVLELTKLEIERGNEVSILHCDGMISSCATNPGHSRRLCLNCIYQVQESRKLHFPEQVTHHWIEIGPSKNLEDDWRFDSLQELAKITWNGHPFGKSVASHLASVTRDVLLPKKLLTSDASLMLTNMVSLHQSFLKHMERLPDKVILWGGRRPAEVAFLAAAQDLNLSVYFLEVGSLSSRYLLTQNNIHTFKGNVAELRNWRTSRELSGELDVAKVEGQTYFKELRDGSSRTPNYLKFNGDFLPFQRSSIRAELQEKPMLVIFSSSAWEVAFYHDYDDYVGEFGDSYRLIQKVGTDLELLREYSVVVRWHPNLSNAGQGESAFMWQVIRETPLCHHILPTDSIDSYSLLEQSEVVLTTGSTIGIEAAAIGRASIVAGAAYYMYCGSVYEPKTYVDLIDLILSHPKPLDPEGALLFGDWMRNRGQALTKVESLHGNFLLDGEDIRRVRPRQAFRTKIRNLLMGT
jgi:hypothetical protein